MGGSSRRDAARQASEGTERLSSCALGALLAIDHHYTRHAPSIHARHPRPASMPDIHNYHIHPSPSLALGPAAPRLQPATPFPSPSLSSPLTKVAQRHSAVLVHQHVVCVHVAVADAGGVAVAQRVRYSRGQPQRPARREADVVAPLAAQQVLTGGLGRQRRA